MNSELQDKIQAVLDQIVADHPHWANPNRSFGLSKKACRTVAEQLAQIGVDSKFVHLAEFQGSLSRAHKQWRWLRSGHYFVHHVVLVDDMIIDLAAKQFDHADAYPKFVSVNEFIPLWADASVLRSLETGEVDKTLRQYVEQWSGARAFAPRFDHDAMGNCFYRDDHVYGAVKAFECEEGRGIAISQWASFVRGRGDTVRALEWLRERFQRIVAVQPANETGDGMATAYWQHMHSKGLVDALLDRDGFEISLEQQRVDEMAPAF